ncbi:MAG: response regulator [Elusimicrobiota bacterium]
MGTVRARRKILIVDDEEHIVLYLTTLLEDHGYDVVSSMDPLEAFRLAKTERPDLICLDIMMPKKSGLSLYREFRSDAGLKSIPVVVISGIGNIAYGFKADFRKHVPDPEIPEPEAIFEKPLKAAKFVEFLDRALGRGEGA